MVAHEEVRERLAAYAAGVLEAAAAAGVRAHLAAGCAACREALFAAPVGLPRPGPPRARPGAARRGTRAVVAALAAVVAAALATGLLGYERQLRDGVLRALREEAVRRAEADRSSAALTGRLERAKDALRSRGAVASREREALAQRLAAAQQEARGLRRAVRAGRSRLAELEAEMEAARAGMDVAAREGLEVRTLVPARPFVGPTGHALWRPEDGRMLVHAAGLPAAPGAAGYVARVTLADGRVLGAELAPAAAGGAVAHLVLPRGSAVDAVEVRRAADARRILIAQGRLR